MTAEEIVKMAAAMSGFRNASADDWRKEFERLNQPPARDPSAVSFVKRDGVWEMPR